MMDSREAINEAANALMESKREEFIETIRATRIFHPGEPVDYFDTFGDKEFKDPALEWEFIGYCLGHAQAAPAKQGEQWKPSLTPNRPEIHHNPDAAAWADYFMEVFPHCGADPDTMLAWFANAMMAMHDHLQTQQGEQEPLPNEQGKNRYGLDMAYFRNLINRELNHSRGLHDYKPSELARVFARMASAADSAVLSEPEFADPKAEG